MMTVYHKPVMLEECLEGLNINPSGTYVDTTFGGGGHSAAMLAALDDDGKLFAFDQDQDALQNALHDTRFQLINQNFSFLSNFLRLYKATPIDGLLADLGVSSHQFDTAERGFSTRFEGPLDMRMNQLLELKASDVLNTYEEAALIAIFREYGELKNARQLTHAILNRRAAQPFETIQELKESLLPFAPKHRENKFFAQVFQALRIEVNKELESLKKLLTQSEQVIRKGGRLVVITYHSLEDRLVKNYIKMGKFSGEMEKDFYGNPLKPFKAINRKPITAKEEEIKNNPRARSAKLRIAERL